jgi:hypothetical protein
VNDAQSCRQATHSPPYHHSSLYISRTLTQTERVIHDTEASLTVQNQLASNTGFLSVQGPPHCSITGSLRPLDSIQQSSNISALQNIQAKASKTNITTWTTGQAEHLHLVTLYSKDINSRMQVLTAGPLDLLVLEDIISKSPWDLDVTRRVIDCSPSHL